jgi:hypothetical protein
LPDWSASAALLRSVCVLVSLQNASLTQTNIDVFINSHINNSTTSINGLFGDALYHSNSTDSLTTFHNVPKNYIISVLKHNYLPYIAPLYLQNEEVSGSNYIHADEVFIGNSVSTEKMSGDLVVKHGASVTIETSNNVTLDAGFIVELGGRFEIKNK